MKAPLFSLGGAILLIGCGPPYAGKARIDPHERLGDVGGYIEVQAFLHAEAAFHSGAPTPAKITQAQCVDERVCEAVIRDGKRVLVGGKTEGESDLRVSFVQQNGGEISTETIRVRFSPRATQPLALGQVPYKGEETARIWEQAGAPPGLFRCGLAGTPERLSSALDLGDLTRGQAKIFLCTPGEELATGRWYLPSGRDPLQSVPGPRDIYACQHQVTRTGEYTSLVVYRPEGASGLSLVTQQGTPGAVCYPKK